MPAMAEPSSGSTSSPLPSPDGAVEPTPVPTDRGVACPRNSDTRINQEYGSHPAGFQWARWPISRLCLFAADRQLVQRHGLSDKAFEPLFIDLLAFLKINGAPEVAFQAG